MAHGSTETIIKLVEETRKKTGEWGNYEKLVLQELRRHSSVLEAMDSKVQSLAVELAKYADHEDAITTLQQANTLLRERIASLEVRSSIIGAASGFLAALGTGIVAVIVTMLGK